MNADAQIQYGTSWRAEQTQNIEGQVSPTPSFTRESGTNF